MTDHRPRRNASGPLARPRRGPPVAAGLLLALGVIGAAAIVALGSLVGGRSLSPAPSVSPGAGSASRLGSLEAIAFGTVPSPSPTVSGGPASPSPTGSPLAAATNIYAGAGVGMFSPTVAGFPERVYVPDEATGTVVVIDPRTFKILYRYAVGASPEHVTPDWDL